MMQSREAILAEIRRIDESNDDFFGAWRGELVGALDFQTATDAGFLRADAQEADWKPTLTDEAVRDEAADYLEFALGKAEDHRGLSANRSVDHYLGWVWLVGGEEALEELQNTPYPMYGVPVLKRAAELLGIENTWQKLTAGNPEVLRMSEGQQCTPGCDEGC